jgi:hypothetical protein
MNNVEGWLDVVWELMQECVLLLLFVVVEGLHKKLIVRLI